MERQQYIQACRDLMAIPKAAVKILEEEENEQRSGG